MYLYRIARQCPDSRFLGRATLPGYRWQINNKGNANIVKVDSNQASVQGLCYLLSPKDEMALSEKEKVPRVYQRMFVEVQLVTASASLVGRDVTEILDQSGRIIEIVGEKPRRRAQTVEALVYLSLDETIDGPPEEKHVAEIQVALEDAQDLGLSRDYADSLRDVIFASQSDSGSRHQSQREYELEERTWWENRGQQEYEEHTPRDIIPRMVRPAQRNSNRGSLYREHEYYEEETPRDISPQVVRPAQRNSNRGSLYRQHDYEEETPRNMIPQVVRPAPRSNRGSLYRQHDYEEHTPRNSIIPQVVRPVQRNNHRSREDGQQEYEVWYDEIPVREGRYPFREHRRKF
ncbi:hypothetical protein BDV28DRAFT_148332 [Aspergillus coremiiformis]|uniref:gamma-glutamylcyclotransferase n=1 Tax=Aspergillus coremiiformis TaxID=138285 RepID=A0A5N6ZAP9_9EURO|nr:hypothetical protein BDV28DRAFT_148332 [Aspergillus coremiiformis]